MMYAVVSLGGQQELFLVAKDQIEELEKVLGAEIAVLVEFEG